VRTCYDRPDETVMPLMRKARAALPPGGTLIMSEAMSGGRRPDRAGDAYFGFYTLAMGSGRSRSPERIMDMMRKAGFVGARRVRAGRPFLTSMVTAKAPGD
jgi:demethylspheroidene O-methyltransferase